MKNQLITIVKKPGIKDCVRINKEEDIPKKLKDVIRIQENKLILDCLEGEEIVPIGSVIAYEKLKNGKMNVWNKANWQETTIEKNGIFYEKPITNKAIRVTENLPKYITDQLEDKLTILEDSTYQIITDWGIMKCKPYNGYLVIYGTKDDGSLNVNFLTKGTPSFSKYYVVDKNGNIAYSLEEYDKQCSIKNKQIKRIKK